jgi:DegV family protein with EDD domain
VSQKVAVVTDSTAYLPSELIDRYGIAVVPVSVVVDGAAYDEGVDITALEVADALRRRASVTTSRPTPARFLAAYSAAAQAGATHIVSAHLSADMSGTYDSAIIAARESPIPVRVLDTRSVGMAMGFAIIDGAIAARAGSDLNEVATLVLDRVSTSSVLFYVDTLDYLRRGGRVGAAQAALGQALSVKPILELVDGRVVPCERVRTAAKALARLTELAVERAGDHVCDVAVQHLDAAARAQTLAELLATALPNARILVSEVGAVVGAHVGPGMVAVGISPRL